MRNERVGLPTRVCGVPSVKEQRREGRERQKRGGEIRGQKKRERGESREGKIKNQKPTKNEKKIRSKTIQGKGAGEKRGTYL